MIRKSFELIKDKLFDLCYKIVWMHKGILALMIFYGFVCFYMSYYRYQTMVSWSEAPPRNELQRVSGRLLEYDRRRGGPNSGPDRLEIVLEDGSRYYITNGLLRGVVWWHMYDEIHPGDLIELRVHRFGNDKYEPRVVEISGENYCALSYEEGKMFYVQDAQDMANEPEELVIAGIFLCMYGIIFLAIQHWLSR